MIAVFLAEGFEEVEALTAVDLLRRENFEVKTVSVSEAKFVTGSHGIKVEADLVSAEFSPAECECLVLPGGMPGTLNLDGSPFVDGALRFMYENGRRIAAICAAPLCLGRRGMLEGKNATCFPGFEKELKGANHLNIGSISDGLITTGRSMEDALGFAKELADALKKDRLIGEIEEKYASLYDEETISTIKELNCLFKNFGLKGEFTEAKKSPRLVTYYFAPKRNEKATSYLKLSDDISLTLAVEGVRVTVAHPSESIAVEVPRKDGEAVLLPELLSRKEFANLNTKTPIAIGINTEGEAVYADLAKLPHLLISGATGMGKSIFLHSLITGIIKTTKPSEVRLLLVDTKQVEFNCYEGLPHLLVPVIKDEKTSLGALRWLVDEMERRYSVLRAKQVRNIDAYNAAADEGDRLPKIVLIIDELADLMVGYKSNAETFLMFLAQKSRAAGIHIVISTQRPAVSVITGVIKANIPARICFKVISSVDSRTLLDSTGAEKLLSKGDALFVSPSLPYPVRVETPFVSSADIANAVNEAKLAYPEEENVDILKEIVEKIPATEPECDEEEDDEENPLLDDGFVKACLTVIKAGAASTSLLQRKLMIGYGKAAMYIDIMTDIGIISDMDGAKPRDVLVSEEEFDNMLKKVRK